MILDKFKERYDALQPLPDTGWDMTWADRLRTWEDFCDRGHEVAIALRLNQISAANYEGDMRGLAPGLHDLLLEAFPITPADQAELDTWKAEFGFIE